MTQFRNKYDGGIETENHTIDSSVLKPHYFSFSLSYPQSHLCLAEKSVYLYKVHKTLYVLPSVQNLPLSENIPSCLILSQVNVELR